jgi:hypothetical protein
MTRSQTVFVPGALGKVAMILSPSGLNISSNADVKTGSQA